MPLIAHYGHSFFDFTNFNNECILANGNSGTYLFKREADSDKFITLRRLRLLYRDLGAAVINLNIQGQNQDGSLNSVNVSNFAFGNINVENIVWCYTDDFEITITIPQLSFVRVSGPISILRFTLIGDSEQLPTI